MLSSCVGLSCLLRDEDPATKLFALQRLISGSDTFWPEMVELLPLLDEYASSTSYPDHLRKLAALAVSKVYYHTGSTEKSATYALRAVPCFNFQEKSEFTEKVVHENVRQYIAQRQAAPETIPLDLEAFFSEIFHSWSSQSTVFTIENLFGLAVSSQRLDLLQALLGDHLRRTGNMTILKTCAEIANTHAPSLTFRSEVIRTLAHMYRTDTNQRDLFPLLQCLIFLKETSAVAELLSYLFESHESSKKVIAMQLAFQISELCKQEFTSSIIVDLEKIIENDMSKGEKYAKLLRILRGRASSDLYLQFLSEKNTADVGILVAAKKQADGSNSVTHNAVVLAHAMMYCGTTVDKFLRDNLTWLAKSSNWAKFAATASVGIVHRGNIGQGMKILGPYLPKAAIKSPYQEGGALLGLGLISAPLGVFASIQSEPEKETDTVEYLSNALRNYSSFEPVIHGAALGLGLTAMGSFSTELSDVLLALLGSSDAVAGEGCAIACGLVMLGSAHTETATTLLTIAREKDQKEKVIRGCSMSVALVMFGQEERALTWAEQLLVDRDHWVRMGGCMTLALAFAGTGNMEHIQRLLRCSISETSNDVRRTALICVGFLTLRDPGVTCRVLGILQDSYNPHVRYGIALAVGIAAAGSGHSESVKLLFNMTNDTCDFVRQGATLALSMVLVQKSSALCEMNAEGVKGVSKNPVEDFRTLLSSRVNDRHVDTCTKFGSIIALGIIDAGGRNATFRVVKEGHMLTKSIVALFLFSQYWFWFPNLLFLSQAMLPTCFIGVDSDLKVPDYTIQSNAPPSRFAPPKSLKTQKKKEKQRHKEVQLSISKKKIVQDEQSNDTIDSLKGKQDSTSMEVDEKVEAVVPSSSQHSKATKESMEVDHPTIENDKNVEEVDSVKHSGANAEPTYEILHNPARVLPEQFALLDFSLHDKYEPIQSNITGICMLVEKSSEGNTEVVGHKSADTSNSLTTTE